MIIREKAKGNIEAHKRLENYALIYFKGFATNISDTSIKPDFLFIHKSFKTLIFVECLIEPSSTIIKHKIEKYIDHCDQLWFFIYKTNGIKFNNIKNDKVRLFYYPEILEEIKQFQTNINSEEINKL